MFSNETSIDIIESASSTSITGFEDDYSPNDFEVKQLNFYRKLLVRWAGDGLLKKEVIDYTIGFYIIIVHKVSGKEFILSQSGFV